MTLYLLERWKSRLGGPGNASSFLMTLSSESASVDEKRMIIRMFDDWDVITSTWFEIADYLDVLEELYENEAFGPRNLAALLASKVAYCLGDYSEALNLALAAEDEFKLTPRPVSPNVGHQDEQYVNKMIEQALDTYIEARCNRNEVDRRLEILVNRIFERNVKRKELRYAIGLALDARRIDMLVEAIKASEDQAALLTETVSKVLDSQVNCNFRSEVLHLLLNLFSELEEPDFVSMCQCLIKLEKPEDVAEILRRLVTNQKNGLLLAYQIAFDLYENASQQFINRIEKSLICDKKTSSATLQSSERDEPMECTAEECSLPSISAGSDSRDSKSHETETLSELKISAPAFEMDATVRERLRSILRGEQTIKHHMQFLIKNNHTDMLILKQMKDSVRTASAHNATVVSNGIMHLGTTTDDFLRANLDWISKATNWNKFNAVASLGLIHKGHECSAQKLLEPYLPKGEADQYGFKEGGSLYAYGLIHANHGSSEVIRYLRDQLNRATTSAVRHGACLGLGLAAMGIHDEDVYLQLRDCLYQDDAVTGEAAGLAMGLVMVGGVDAVKFEEMVQYVCDTQHDKIQRGLRCGIALLMYGKQEEAECFISQLMVEHKSNSILRSAAICCLAMAYAGSGKANIVKRLLVSVANDPNQDVKRFAVIAIGFVLSNDPEQCLNYAGMLIEHFNPHIRYGAAIALGISCAGSRYKEAVTLLEQLLQAKENFVRQGAIIALSFILIQQTETTSSKVTEFRRILTKMITEKGEDSLTKFGAILAQGVIDAGGRNVTISLHNRNGHSDMHSVVGMFVFLQYWYWHSFAHFSSLIFKPTCLIGLNSNLEMPITEFRSNAKPSIFAYPAPLEEKKKEENEKVETAVLSVTNKKKVSTADKGCVDKKEKSSKNNEKSEEKMEVDPVEGESSANKGSSKEPEPPTHNLQNPARVVSLQLKTLQMIESSRYKPLKALSQGGIIMLMDKKAGEEQEEIVATVPAGGTRASDPKDSSSEEAQPHSPFEIIISAY